MIQHNKKNIKPRLLGIKRHDFSLWGYTNLIYERLGVAEVCMELQDTAKVDVPLLFCAGYASLSGKCLDKTSLRRLCDICGPWRNEIVQPLRLIRKCLKCGHKSLNKNEIKEFRSQLKLVELNAERIQIELMQDLVAKLPKNNTECDIKKLSSVLIMVLEYYSQEPFDGSQKSKISFLAEQMYHY